MNDNKARPTLYIPEHLQAEWPEQGCTLALTLHDGRYIPGVCIDSQRMIYGVLIKTDIASRPNPIDFSASDFSTIQMLSEIPPGYSFA